MQSDRFQILVLEVAGNADRNKHSKRADTMMSQQFPDELFDVSFKKDKKILIKCQVETSL